MKKFLRGLNVLIEVIFQKRTVYADVTTAQTTENDGVILDHAIRAVYSKEIEFKALPLLLFRQFATVKTELGKEPGDTISMLTYDNLQLGGALRENVPMSTQALSQSMKQLTVDEYGNAVANTQRLITTSFDDVMATTTNLLARDYALTIDCLLRDTVLSGTNVVYANKKDSTKVTSRTDIDSTCTLKVSTIKDAIEVLATANAPKYAGQHWICIVHPHQSRDLRDDPAWINASNYGAPTQLFTGEIGRIDDTRFIETTIMCNGKATTKDYAFAPHLKNGFAGNSENPEVDTDVFQAVIFGDAYYGLATALPVELRDNGIEDFGRKRSLAWYGIFGAGILHDEYGVVIETA